MNIPLELISESFANFQRDLYLAKGREEKQKIVDELDNPNGKYSGMKQEVQRKIRILDESELKYVKYAPGPGISKEIINSSSPDVIIYLNNRGFQTAEFLQKNCIDYGYGSNLYILNVDFFKRTIKEMEEYNKINLG